MRELTAKEKELIKLLDECVAIYKDLPVIEGFNSAEFIGDLLRWKGTIEYRREIVDH